MKIYFLQFSSWMEKSSFFCSSFVQNVILLIYNQPKWKVGNLQMKVRFRLKVSKLKNDHDRLFFNIINCSQTNVFGGKFVLIVSFYSCKWIADDIIALLLVFCFVNRIWNLIFHSFIKFWMNSVRDVVFHSFWSQLSHLTHNDLNSRRLYYVSACHSNWSAFVGSQ